jgi:hypothetical protein
MKQRKRKHMQNRNREKCKNARMYKCNKHGVETVAKMAEMKKRENEKKKENGRSKR